jgi:preprotein translocase subunit SecD
VTVLARTKFYGSGHPMSGLDPARLGAGASWRASVRRTQSRRRPDSVPRGTGSRTAGSRPTDSRPSGEA